MESYHGVATLPPAGLVKFVLGIVYYKKYIKLIFYYHNYLYYLI